MLAARNQAEQYARALPPAEGWPPFLVVVDVGHTIELFSDFTRSGKTYVPFPDPLSHRIHLADLARPETRARLAAVWTDPLSLDPSRHAAKVTREVAARLALLARSLEAAGHPAADVAGFLMRCLFTMFAEDVRLIPEGGFSALLESLRAQPANFRPMAESLWTTMNTGGFSPILRETLLRFNGGLFETCDALPLDADQLALLIDAARSDWGAVEPAIFGTLLERALDPVERHKLGAHYTPRAYVERLVMPTIVEPLRDEWAAVQAAAVTLERQGKRADAVAELRAFHRRLCAVRVLDPACGSGNFLYVTLEHLKRLEGEVLNLLEELDEAEFQFESEGFNVDPHQLLGLEINPRAAAIADLVLWIGYLQWHFRTRGQTMPRQPVLQKFHNIECRDAVLAYDGVEPLLDADGNPVTHWDGRTTKTHPVTGEEVPDETAREPVMRYLNPRKAEWPEADYVVGNPPFIGTARMRDALGDGYTEALRATHNDVPESCDFVMYWWNHAANLLRGAALECGGHATALAAEAALRPDAASPGRAALRRFGFITTNSLRQTFNRRVLERHMAASDSTGPAATPLSIVFAIPDHPWVDAADGAAVRIAMTTAEAGEHAGDLLRVLAEVPSSNDAANVSLGLQIGRIVSDLTVGADVGAAVPLDSNSLLSSRGVQVIGSGFIVTVEEAGALGLDRVPGIDKHIRPYLNGRDITATPRGVMVIDLFGLSVAEVQERFPEVYQWVRERVKPERDQNNRASYRDNWWIHGEPRRNFRPALDGLPRYIATVETSKHRFFVFLDAAILPDNMLVNIALDDARFLGVLSSRAHVTWALAAGGTLEDRPRYNKTRCFDPFPFPVCTDAQAGRIRELGEALDAHRKRQQALHPELTITGMYNVLEKLREGGVLTAKEKTIHEQGLVSVLRQIHDDLDAAVFDAYGWPATLTDEEILERLVALNHERAEEEKRGQVRWLRPEYQCPETAPTQDNTQQELQLPKDAPAAKTTAGATPEKLPWPATLPEQVQAVRAQRARLGPVTAETIAQTFQGRRSKQVTEILETLKILGER
jgi:SAM-dependent methyltransferase